MNKTARILVNIFFFLVEMFFIWSCAKGVFYDYRAGQDGWAALNVVSLAIWTYLLWSHAENVPKQFAEAKIAEEKKKKEQQKEESKEVIVEKGMFDCTTEKE